jgi:MoaA/NifB/PqqE/SkfB family radical SAM enzyme
MKIHELGNRYFPVAMVNITNRCTLRCRHCFVYREGNPNRHPKRSSEEMDRFTMLQTLEFLRDKHRIHSMVWMGGEPLLRKNVLCEGLRLFKENTIVTNGTLDLLDLGRCVYVVSLDGPKEVNDPLRGKGSFRRVMNTLHRIPRDFGPTVQVQCVVTRENQERVGELIPALQNTRVEGLTYTFYIPRSHDTSSLAWRTLQEREPAVLRVMELKSRYPEFVWNSMGSLKLMLPENAKEITDHCLPKKYLLPLYLDGKEFDVPFCCAGNDVNCELCGMWGVFHFAAKLKTGTPSRYFPGPFSDLLRQNS